ncbi:ATP-binding cassette domain-containing protein [Polaromonas sp. P1(28)-8]|nr:ATP-binding cassette domain-containing protein [Polaromonas sp. P1(28)-8]
MPRRQLRGVSLEVSAGEQIAVIGPSGAGKTTLLHVLACALPPSSGSLQLNARPLAAAPQQAAAFARRAVSGTAGAAPAAASASSPRCWPVACRISACGRACAACFTRRRLPRPTPRWPGLT